MPRNTISNSDDIIDSRDIIERLQELEDAYADASHDEDGNLLPDFNPESFEEWDELAALRALAEEASSSPDWDYGETLIRDSYFRAYAEELADDIGAIDRSANWPLDCIDWEKAANDLKADYFSVDFDGVEYWIRA